MPDGLTPPDARYRAGIAALADRRPADAVAWLEGAVAAGEAAPWAALNLGLACMQLGRVAAALPLLRASAEALPQLAEVRFQLGTALGLRGEPALAAAQYRDALALEPDHLLALAGLAAIEESGGRPDAAASLIERAIVLAPEEPELRVVAARLALARGEPEATEQAARAALEGSPGHPRAAALLAEALLATHGPDAAAATVATWVAADPLRADWPLVMAALDGRAGRLDKRVGELRIAVALRPERTDLLAELGKALWEADHRPEAEATLRQAIALRPADIDLRNWLATLLWRMQRPSEMLEWIQSARRDFGPAPTLEINRALALSALGEQAAALEAADAAIALAPDSASAAIARMQVLAYHPEHGNATALLAAGREVAARLGPPAPVPRFDADPDRPLRVGLLSGSLGAHPVGWLTVAAFEALAAEPGFDLTGYALRPKRDMVNNRFRVLCRGWHEMGALDDAGIAARIREDACDILIDLGGYGDSGRPYVLQRRPAPVQIKWVGSQFATTGLDCLDGMLTDRWETPAGFERHYTEPLLRLPDGYVCFAPPPYAPPVAPPPSLAKGYVTFGCYNNLAKVTPVVLETWAAILRAVPDARLELRGSSLSEPATAERTARRCADAGLPMDRVALRPGCKHPQLLAAYGEIDIALDPFPYAGGLTVCEALWMGVPVVTLAGDSFAGRHAASHLSNVGMADWVTEDVAGYRRVAIERAADFPALAALRAAQRARVAASPLCDGPRFGRHLAATLRATWQARCAG